MDFLRNKLTYSHLLIILSFLFINCSTTSKIESFEKPGTELHSYNNVLIYCNFDNLKYRKQLEDEFYKQFSRKNIVAIKSLDVLSPLESYSDTEKDEIFKAKNIEIILEIKTISTTSNNGDNNFLVVPSGGSFWILGSSDVKVTVSFDITITDILKQEKIFMGTATYEEEDDEISECLEEIFESLAEDMVKEHF